MIMSCRIVLTVDAYAWAEQLAYHNDEHADAEGDHHQAEEEAPEFRVACE